MHNTFFVLAPDDGYLYCTPKKSTWNNLDPVLNEFLVNHSGSRMLWAAFGPGSDNYCFNFVAPDGTQMHATGDDTPEELETWLNAGCDEHVRIALGPDKSFFAWDSNKIRWHNIPAGLEKAIQGWLGPAGWKEGPPRIVTLGTRGSYFALAEYGAIAWSIPGTLPRTAQAFNELRAHKASGAFSFTDLEYVTFSACQDDRFIFIKKDLTVIANLPEPRKSFDACFETLFNDETAKKRWKQREWNRDQEEEDDDFRQHAAEDARNARATANERARRDGDSASEDMTLQYLLWKSAWESDFAQGKLLTTFPHLPLTACTCVDVSCQSRKIEGSLMACQHDVEKLLRASGSYSLDWLRRERLWWHPDRFGLRCDPDFRKELVSKATELYAIFEVLIDAEKAQEGRL